MGILLQVDILQHDCDVVLLGDFRRSLEPFDATLVLGRPRHPRHDVARHDDDGAALELLHGRKRLAQVGKKSFSRPRISHAMLKPGGDIESDPQLTPFAVGLTKLLCRPVFVLPHQFHGVIAGFRDLFKPLFKRQLFEYRP